MLLLAVGCYFWMMGHDKSSLPLALLEEKNVGALPGDEIVLVKDQGWVQLKDEATVIYDTVGKSNVEEHQIEKNEQETKTDVGCLWIGAGSNNSTERTACEYRIFRWY